MLDRAVRNVSLAIAVAIPLTFSVSQALGSDELRLEVAPVTPTVGRPALRVVLHTNVNPSVQIDEYLRVRAQPASVPCADNPAAGLPGSAYELMFRWDNVRRKWNTVLTFRWPAAQKLAICGWVVSDEGQRLGTPVPPVISRVRYVVSAPRQQDSLPSTPRVCRSPDRQVELLSTTRTTPCAQANRVASAWSGAFDAFLGTDKVGGAARTFSTVLADGRGVLCESSAVGRIGKRRLNVTCDSVRLRYTPNDSAR